MLAMPMARNNNNNNCSSSSSNNNKNSRYQMYRHDTQTYPIQRVGIHRISECDSNLPDVFKAGPVTRTLRDGLLVQPIPTRECPCLQGLVGRCTHCARRSCL